MLLKSQQHFIDSFINFYIGVYQDLKVPGQITSNIHGLGLFVCAGHPVSSLSNAASHGTFTSVGKGNPNAFIF